MGSKTLLGLLFLVAAVAVAGLPPLSGFIGKLALLAAVPAANTGWVWTITLITSLMVLVALSRMGSQVFWRAQDYGSDDDAAPPPPGRLEIAAAMLLLAYGVALAVAAAPVLRYTLAAGEQVLEPATYIEQVLSTQPRQRMPSP